MTRPGGLANAPLHVRHKTLYWGGNRKVDGQVLLERR